MPPRLAEVVRPRAHLAVIVCQAWGPASTFLIPTMQFEREQVLNDNFDNLPCPKSALAAGPKGESFATGLPTPALTALIDC